MTNKILEVFQQFRMAPLPTDIFESVGKRVFETKINSFVRAGIPLDFIMLGFPMKSPNDRDKVLGSLPDLGEELALENFNRFDRLIKEIYSPGIQMNIVSDGFAFNSLLSVSDATVFEYEERNKSLAGISTKFFDLISFFDKETPLPILRDKVLRYFSPTAEELERRILTDPDTHSLYLGMIRFLELDLANRSYPSNRALRTAAKSLAREMMIMNEAYSALVTREFRDSIRLSMHPSINNGTKFSFQLIPSPKAWTSPWHCSILVDKDGIFETIHKKTALEAGHELVYKNGQPYYFQEIKKEEILL